MLWVIFAQKDGSRTFEPQSKHCDERAMLEHSVLMISGDTSLGRHPQGGRRRVRSYWGAIASVGAVGTTSKAGAGLAGITTSLAVRLRLC